MRVGDETEQAGHPGIVVAHGLVGGVGAKGAVGIDPGFHIVAAEKGFAAADLGIECQQAIPGRRRKTCSFNIAGFDFQIPVPAKRGAAGVIIGGGNIGAGGIGQRGNGSLADCATAKITAIDENVGIFGQRFTDRCKRAGVFAGHAGLIQNRIAKHQRALVTMGNNMYGFDRIAAGKMVGNFLDSIAAGIENDHLYVAVNFR